MCRRRARTEATDVAGAHHRGEMTGAGISGKRGTTMKAGRVDKRHDKMAGPREMSELRGPLQAGKEAKRKRRARSLVRCQRRPDRRT
jgi:hypothetical protein